MKHTHYTHRLLQYRDAEENRFNKNGGEQQTYMPNTLPESRGLSPQQAEVFDALNVSETGVRKQINQLQLPMSTESPRTIEQELQKSLPVPPKQAQPVQEASAKVSTTKNERTYTIDRHQTSKETVVAAGIGGSIGSVVGATSAAAIQLMMPAAAGTAMLSTAGLAGLGLVAGGMLGAQSYMYGKTHAQYWGRPNEKEPGVLGTIGRGLISSFSIPIGVVYNLVRGKRD